MDTRTSTKQDTRTSTKQNTRTSTKQNIRTSTKQTNTETPWNLTNCPTHAALTGYWRRAGSSGTTDTQTTRELQLPTGWEAPAAMRTSSAGHRLKT